jgi:hypothetical protein
MKRGGPKRACKTAAAEFNRRRPLRLGAFFGLDFGRSSSWRAMHAFSHQKPRGRPATGRDPAVTIRLPEDVLASVEHWAMSQKDQPPRSQAIRRLVELGLKAKSK